MSKITKIQFKNYRAFYGDYTDSQNTLHTENKNVLIYGENGSGKSSVYQGLKDFFQAVKTGREPEKSPKHLKSLGTEDYEIKVTFEGNKEISFLNGGNLSDTLIAQTFELNSFLSYKELLRTHLVSQENFSTQFFDLVFYTLLNNRKFGTTTLQKEVESILKLIDEKEITEKLKKLSAFFEKEIDKIEAKTKDFLEYFTKEEIKIKFNFSNNLGIKNNLLLGNLDLEISYFGNKNIPHLEILNEARLSALAISIFLAGITTNSITTATNLYKILFLDDIFIGLDMSNRLPLLDILKSEFVDYQIFMTTYDRAWFDVAKNKLDTIKWQSIEMYVGKENDFDVSVIIQSKDYFERAKEYFKAFDYPACANYLRKECEKLIKDFLPQNLKYSQDTQKGTINEITDLETLFNNLLKYLEIQSLSKTPFEKFKTYQKVVFNALSHDDLKSPIYKKELEQSFELVENLQKLKLLGEIKENTQLYFEILNNKINILQKYEIQLVEKLRLLEQNGNSKWSKSLCNVFDVDNGRDIYWKEKSLQDVFRKISHSSSQDITFDTNIWFSVIKDKNDKTLQQLINGL